MQVFQPEQHSADLGPLFAFRGKHLVRIRTDRLICLSLLERDLWFFISLLLSRSENETMCYLHWDRRMNRILMYGAQQVRSHAVQDGDGRRFSSGEGSKEGSELSLNYSPQPTCLQVRDKASVMMDEVLTNAPKTSKAEWKLLPPRGLCTLCGKVLFKLCVSDVVFFVLQAFLYVLIDSVLYCRTAKASARWHRAQVSRTYRQFY